MVFPSLLLATALACTNGSVAVDFARGHWNRDDWTVVKSPRLKYCHAFVQMDDRIVNACPDLSAEEIFRTRNDDVYTGMVLKRRFGLGATLVTTTGWDWRMAPLLLIAPEMGVAADGTTPELREHWEVVVYDEGINVWHHFWTPEKGPHWVKAAGLKLPKGAQFKANEKHRLEVTIRRTRAGRKEMLCSCGGYTLQHLDDTLPESFQAGVLGCEGRNFFWDFSVTPAR